MRTWRRWMPSDHAPVEHPLTPVRGKTTSNILIRVYALPGADPAAQFIDDINGIVRRFVEAPAVSDDGDGTDDSVIGLQIIPVAPEMQSGAAHRSQELRRSVSSLFGQTKVSDADLAEIGYLVAHRGGWSALVDYLQWIYTREEVTALSHEKLYAAVERLEPDTESKIVEEERAPADAPGTGLNEHTARTVLENGYYAARVRAGTHDWLQSVPSEESIPPEAAVVTINGETLRSADADSIASTIRATKEMFRDDDDQPYQRRVEEIVRNN